MRVWRERAKTEHLCAQVGPARGDSSMATAPAEPAEQGAG